MAVTRPRIATLSAPDHVGSVSGKCWPMSPRAAAPSMASATAWATTSPSLCPARPVAPSMATPPSTRGRRGSAAEAVAVEAEAHPAGHDRQERFGHDEVGGLGELDVAGVARHHHDSSHRPLRPGRRRRSPRRPFDGPSGAVRPERLGSLHRHQLGAVERRHHPVPGDLLDRVGHGETGDGGVGAGRRAPRRRLGHSSAPARGRAASWTTITSASSGTTSRPARTEAARLDPPPTTASTRRSSTRAGPGTTSTTPPATDRAASIDQSST